MYIHMHLLVPEEPLEIKEGALKRVMEWSFLDGRKAVNLFTLSAGFLPKYLWDHWSGELKGMGLPWQGFLKVVSGCEIQVYEWVNGNLGWDQLVQHILGEVKKLARHPEPEIG